MREYCRLRAVTTPISTPAIAHVARIFDPLMRGPDRQGEDERFGSLGLGLYIASEIARAQDGAIETRSSDTETTFSVSLPRERRAEKGG